MELTLVFGRWKRRARPNELPECILTVKETTAGKVDKVKRCLNELMITKLNSGDFLWALAHVYCTFQTHRGVVE
jgi:hypothetical protein